MFTKLRDFLGFNEAEEFEEYFEEEEVDTSNYSALYPAETSVPVIEEEASRPRRLRENPTSSSYLGMNSTPATRSNVIGMPGIGNGLFEVVVCEPHSFEEMPQVIQSLRDRRSVVLNLNIMDPDEAQRAVDFIAGGTYAIDGHQERIGDSIFLFTPNCVQVTSQSGAGQDAIVPAAPRVAAPTPAWNKEMPPVAQAQ